MKKLMIALAAVACAAAVQAGTVTWASAKNYAMYHAGSTTSTLDDSYTAYLFDSLDLTGYTKQTLLDAANGSGIDFTKAIDQSGFSSDGVLASSKFDAVADQKYTLFVVVKDGDNIFISDVMDAVGPATDDGNITKSFTLKAPSQGSAIDSTTWTKAGWYTAVPEPTSGLLLLLGVAGLALKRKRA